MGGVEFRNPLVFKGSGIPNKVFLDFFGEWNSENEKILNSLGEWNSENERFFRYFFSYLKIREWNSENGRSGIPKIEEWNSENEEILNSLGEWTSELFLICISFLFFRVFWGILLEVFSLYEFVYTK